MCGDKIEPDYKRLYLALKAYEDASVCDRDINDEMIDAWENYIEVCNEEGIEL